jgi:sugar lactone lactonase YvrE
VDASGDLYIADTGNTRIRKVDRATGLIHTVAGGSAGFSGDGGPAIQADLNEPRSVVADSRGNIYFSDSGNNRIRKIDSAGMISTVAGTGLPGSSGDGGPAVTAQLNEPVGLALDDNGNVVIADSLNHRIRRVSSTGIIATIAGSGQQGFSGDHGSAVSAQLDSPLGVSVDIDGGILVADSGNHRVRRLDLSGNIETLVGTGDPAFAGDNNRAELASLRQPAAVVAGGASSVFVSDSGNNRIRKVFVDEGKFRSPIGSARTPIITTVAGSGQAVFIGDGGPAGAANLRTPVGLSIDGGGNIAIADASNERIRVVDFASGIIRTLAGPLAFPQSVAFDAAGRLYVAESDKNRIVRIDPSGLTIVAGSGEIGSGGDGGPAASASLRFPSGIAFDLQGNLLIADTGNNRIRRVDFASGIITRVAQDAPLRGPTSLTVDRA